MEEVKREPKGGHYYENQTINPTYRIINPLDDAL